MGMDFWQSTGYNMPQSYDWAKNLPDFRQFMESLTAPKAPGMPASKRAIGGMESSIATNLPQIQQFLTSMLASGGINKSSVGEQIGNMAKSGLMSRDKIMRDVSAMYPLGSTAGISAATQGMNEADLNNRLGIGQFLMSVANQENANKFGAMQGMESIPGYIGQPSSVETSMINALTPYSEMGNQLNISKMGNLAQLLANSKFTPEMWTREGIGPMLMGGLFKALAAYLGTL